MKKYLSYKILPEFKLILENFKGQVTVEDIINLKKIESMDNSYNPKFNIIADIRDSEYISYDSAIESTISLYFNFRSTFFTNSKVAILTATPHQVVISTILKKLCTNLESLLIEIFSTMEAAIRFINIPIENFNHIKDIISDLNDNTL